MWKMACPVVPEFNIFENPNIRNLKPPLVQLNDAKCPLVVVCYAQPKTCPRTRSRVIMAGRKPLGRSELPLGAGLCGDRESPL